MRPVQVGLALLALLLLAPAADAQLSQSALDVTVAVGDDQPAGNETDVVFTVERMCASSLYTLSEQVVHVTVDAKSEGPLVSGPTEVTFGMQVCATEPTKSLEVAYTVRTPANASSHQTYEFHALFSAPGSAPSAAPPDVEIDFVVTVAKAQVNHGPPPTGTDDEPTAVAAPALPSVLLAVALLAAAFALRRR
jgi:MYXO-CTERM domain-containing protein